MIKITTSLVDSGTFRGFIKLRIIDGVNFNFILSPEEVHVLSNQLEECKYQFIKGEVYNDKKK